MPEENQASQVAATELVKRLGLIDASMIVAGSMIGSGIFIVSAGIARQVGSPGLLLVVWLATGLMTIMGALCYAELAAAMPLAGGEYVFLRESLGRLWGFAAGDSNCHDCRGGHCVRKLHWCVVSLVFRLRMDLEARYFRTL